MEYITRRHLTFNGANYKIPVGVDFVKLSDWTHKL